MSSSGKRLDLRFGVFACSIQGFDDPVQPVQQILRAIQHLLEETPELADAGINFDPDTIERLIGEVAQRAEIDEDRVEIVPGLVMIHHASGGDLARPGGARAPDTEAPDAPDAGDYVNIFAGAGDRDASDHGSEADDRAAGERAGEPGEDLAARMDRMTGAERAGNGADYGWDDPEDAAEDAAEGGKAPGGASMFAMRDERGQGARDDQADDGPAANLFAADADDHGADEPGADDHGGSNLFADADGEAADTAYHDLRFGDGAARDASPDPAGAWAGEDTGEEAGEEAGHEAGEAEEGYTPAGIAERAKATTVPELMVSAAAWMVLIQGSTRFTRRDVLDVFEQIPGDHENTAEARIKGFGKAVRNGQLVSIEDGVFGLSRDELERFQSIL